MTAEAVSDSAVTSLVYGYRARARRIVGSDRATVTRAMLVKGWVAAEWGISENNRRARLYRLTGKGRKQLAAETKAFEKVVESIQLVMRTV